MYKTKYHDLSIHTFVYKSSGEVVCISWNILLDLFFKPLQSMAHI